MQEPQVQSLGWEDSLEKVMTIHSNILAWRIPWTEEPRMLQSMGSQRVGHDWATNTSTSIQYIKNIYKYSTAEHWRIDAFELWCWRRLLRVPWTARRSNLSILKEISPEYSLEAVAEAEAPILWPHDVKNWLTGKDPDAGKKWRQQEEATREDEMVGWHHHVDGHEFEQALGAGDGQGSLACCSPWACKESDMTERLNWTELIHC